MEKPVNVLHEAWRTSPSPLADIAQPTTLRRSS